MKKRTLITLLGLWIALVPFLGIPSSWKSRITIVSGLAVAFFAITKSRGGYSKNVMGNDPASSLVRDTNNKEHQADGTVSSVTTFVPASAPAERTENSQKESTSTGMFSKIKKARKTRVAKASKVGDISNSISNEPQVVIDSESDASAPEVEIVKVYKVSNEIDEKVAE